jgi:PAS domain S-box-containing protein/putative nucleotidyltransferase with HDIG domain
VVHTGRSDGDDSNARGELDDAMPSSACPVNVGDLIAAAVASTTDAVYTIAPDGAITSWNSGAERLYGYTADEAIGQHVSLLTGFQNRPQADLWAAHLSRGEHLENQRVERRHKGGHSLFMSLTMAPITMPDGSFVGASTIARDVTWEREWQHRLAEMADRAELQASMLDVILRYTPDMLFLVDPDGRFVFASQPAQDMLGMTIEQLAGRTGAQLDLPAAFVEVLDEARDRAVEDRVSTSGETVLARSGSSRHLEFSLAPVTGPEGGPVTGAVVTLRDVTARKHAESELAAEKAFADAIIDAAPGLFYTLDRDGRVVRWNAALSSIMPGGPESMPGLNLLDLLAPEDRERAAAALRLTMETGEGEAQARLPVSGNDFVLTGRRVEIAGAPYLVGFGLDVTARVRAEEEVIRARDELETRVEERTAELRAANRRLKRTERALLTLSWSNQTLVRATDPAGLMQDVCEAAVEVGGYRMAWVGSAEHDDARTVRPVAFAGADDGFLSEVTIGWGDEPQGQSSTGRAIRSMRPVLVSDIASDPECAPWASAAAEHGFGSVLSLPLIDPRGEVVGAFSLFGADAYAFDDREIALLEELAMDLAFGVDSLGMRVKRAEAEEQLRVSYGQLETMVRDVVESMGRIVEVRDPYTQGHERRVAELAKSIAVEMGLSADDTAAVDMAAMLHDIGKLSVPAEILTKPGTLSVSEFELIKDHSRRGYEILKDIAFPWPIADIVLQHHERVDGSGYPAGLKGEEILPAARILAVADVVEAMASHRPYRPLIGLGKAMEEIRERPASYDADVVAACGQLFDKGLILL